MGDSPLHCLCQLPSHQICNEHPVAVCANTSTWVKEGEGSTSLVDDTDQPSVQANPAVRESWPQQVPSLCRHGHLHPRCPSSNRLPEDPPARREFFFIGVSAF